MHAYHDRTTRFFHIWQIQSTHSRRLAFPLQDTIFPRFLHEYPVSRIIELFVALFMYILHGWSCT